MGFFIILRIFGFLLALSALVYFIWYIARRFSLYRRGAADERLRPVMTNAEIQAAISVRMKRDRLSAVSHSLIIVGFIFGILGHCTGPLAAIRFPDSFPLIIGAVRFATFIGGSALLFIGCAIPLSRRIAKTCERFTRTGDDLISIIVLMLISLSGAFYFFALHTQSDALHSVASFIHVICMALFLFSLPRTKLFHSIVILLKRAVPRLTGAFPLDDGVQKLRNNPAEERVHFGVDGLGDLSRTQRMETDACVSCGLCDDACPAYVSGKSLSPKKLVFDQRRLLDRAMTAKDGNLKIDPDIFTAAYECTSCYACETSCPLLIGKVDAVIGLRRNGLLERGETLPEWKNALRSAEKSGNVLGMDSGMREKLIQDAGIPYFQKGDAFDYVLWLGCYAAYDPKMRKAVFSLMTLLRKAGKKIAVLRNEQCCGDMVRRMGDEYRFQELVEANAIQLAEIGHIPLLTLCPHCSTILKNEYVARGCVQGAHHYAELLPDLIKGRKSGVTAPIKPRDSKPRVVYHDSCFLARVAGVINEPRDFLAAMRPDVELVRLSAEGADTLCCGGGGGRVMAAEKAGERVSSVKMAELAELKADCLLTSCPYCLSMFSDAALSTGLKVMDLLEFACEGT